MPLSSTQSLTERFRQQAKGEANPETNPWANDRNTFELYRRRVHEQVEEMTCAAQAAEIFADKVQQGETLLDAGCGGGYYFWSFQKRKVDVQYFGLDYSPNMIELAREELCPKSGLDPEQFQLGEIEHLDIVFDNVICFNVLTNSPHYAAPLERLLKAANKRLLLRESMGEELVVRYSPDPYLDEGKRHINVYHNTYPLSEVKSFMEKFGFRVTPIKDARTQDGTELVCDIPHTWRILLAERVQNI